MKIRDRVGTLREQVGNCVIGGGKQPCRQAVGDEPVDLFWHRAIERAQTGLDVCNRYADLGGDNSAGHRRVHIADDDDRVDGRCLQPCLERGHDSTGLHGVTATADAEVDVGIRKTQQLEEAARHRCVVVLAGVHEECLDTACGSGAQDRGHLHEVRTSACDDGNALHRVLQSSLIVSQMKTLLPTR